MEGDQENQHIHLYDGVVVDNVDPLKLGRVRVMVPGVIEPYSDWALSMGGSGGGSAERGVWFPPRIGAEVGVMFREGDPDHPRFFVSTWGSPEGSSEAPTFASELTPEEAVQVAGIQTRRFDIVIDDREGHESLTIRDRQFGQDLIEIDGVNHGVTVSGSAAVLIKSLGVVNIQALQVVINGRVVRSTTEPI